MNGYLLTSAWFSYVAENPLKVTCKHTALYLYLVEIFNKRNWVESVGLPTDFTMGLLNISSYKTYSSTLNDLVEFGFIKMVQRSKNQYTSNIIGLVKNTKASSKHIPKQVESNDISKYSINKLLNEQTIKLINDNASLVNSKLAKWIDDDSKKKGYEEIFISRLLGVCDDEQVVMDYVKMKKTQKGVISKITCDSLLKNISACGWSANDVLTYCLEKSWKSFEASWIKPDTIPPSRLGVKVESSHATSQNHLKNIDLAF